MTKMNILRYLGICLFCIIGLQANAQFGDGDKTVLSREEAKKQYEENIKKSNIAGVYIPKDDKEAIAEIKKLAPSEGLSKFKEIENEEEAAKKLYFGLGRWMGVNWSFYEGSRLSHQLKQIGVVHPDDMITYLLISLHRDLNGIAGDHADLIEKLAKERKEIAKKAMGKVISEEVRPIPKN